VDESTQERTGDDIGTKHIDDGREKIKLTGFDSAATEDWQTYKAELLALLDELES